MKRDWGLIRSILLQIQETCDGQEWQYISIAGVPQLDVNNHLQILGDARLIEVQTPLAPKGTDNGNYLPRGNSAAFRVARLTWNGHEFLNSISNDSVWDRTLEQIRSIGGSVPLEVVKQTAIQIATRVLTQS
ncbi:MAG: DUF2513 domain-containing protein [Bryobacterales bacterium]|nr:DUF2513 domain-containing protein [Bryobacterales bacterium]